MEQYFYQLPSSIISKNLKTEIIKFSLNQDIKYIKTLLGGDFYQYSKKQSEIFLSQNDEYKLFLDNFTTPISEHSINIYPAKSISIRHTDPHRTAIIWIPIYPFNGTYPPLVFWANENEEQCETSIGSNNEIILFNAKKSHGCILPIPSVRINIQISFPNSYKQILPLAKENYLFRKI